MAEFRHGEAFFHATDTEVWMSTNMLGTNPDEFDVLLPGKELLRILDNSNETVQIQVDETNINIDADGSKYRFGVLPVEKFPKSIEFGENVVHAGGVKGDELAEAFSLVNPAMAKTSDGQEVAGVAVVHKGDSLMLVVMSHLRFAMTSIDAVWSNQTNGLVATVPAETARTIASCGSDGPMSVQGAANLCRFAWGQSSLVTRVLAKNPPSKIVPYMMPDPAAPKFRIDAEALRSAIKKVSFFDAESDTSYSDKGTLVFRDGELIVSVKGSNGEAAAKAPGTLTGEGWQSSHRMRDVGWAAKAMSGDLYLSKLGKSNYLSVSDGKKTFLAMPSLA